MIEVIHLFDLKVILLDALDYKIKIWKRWAPKKEKKNKSTIPQWRAILGHLQKHQQHVLSWKFWAYTSHLGCNNPAPSKDRVCLCSTGLLQGFQTIKSWPSPFCSRSQLPGGFVCRDRPLPARLRDREKPWSWRARFQPKAPPEWGPHEENWPRLGPVMSSVFTLRGCALGLPGKQGARESSAPGGRLGQLLAIAMRPGVLRGWESCSLLSWCWRLSHKPAAPKVWNLFLYSLCFCSWHYALSTGKNIWLAQHSTGLVIINQYMLIDPGGPRVPAQKDEFFSKYHPRAPDKTGKVHIWSAHLRSITKFSL